jgi:hypothetical protein
MFTVIITYFSLRYRFSTSLGFFFYNIDLKLWEAHEKELKAKKKVISFNKRHISHFYC